MHDDGYFGEDVAARYDDPDDELAEQEPIESVVDVLAGLAGERPGARIRDRDRADRAAARGARRAGRRHRHLAGDGRATARQAGADAIDVTIGDIATTTVDGSFSLVYLVFNTIMNLTTQAAQVACFRNAAAHLEPGGCFLIETSIPGLQRLPPGETFRAYHVSDTAWSFDEYDVANQGLISHHFESVDGRDPARARSRSATRSPRNTT